MHQPRFIPDDHDQKIIKAQTAVFVELVRSVDFITNLNAARKALRLLEAAARRLILVLALMAPALKAQATRAMNLPQVKTIEAAHGPRQPSRRFRLIEPIPGLAAMVKACAPPSKAPPVTRVRIDGFGLAVHYSPPDPEATAPLTDITPWDQVVARLEALKDVARRPDHHANRLRRWIARQAGRRLQNRPSRASPLRPGWPQPLKRADWLNPTRYPRDPFQNLLFECHYLHGLAASP